MKISWPVRIIAILAGVMLLALLLTARSLQPSPDGLGTHQQLGLPPCTSMALFLVRCPACGMTTSWALATRGRFFEAASVNVGGLMLAIIALAYLPASWYFFTRGTASRGEWFSMALAISLAVSLLAASIQWVYRVMYG